MNNNIDIHADDYGYTLNTSKDILDLMKDGLLDSISIIPNTSYFDESMELLYESIPSLPFLPLLSVHLNLIDGYNLSNTSLLSKNDKNVKSWGEIFIISIGGMKKVLKKQLKAEIKVQIDKAESVISKCIEIAIDNGVPCFQKGIRIDSHIHTHSIPMEFEALIEVIKEEHYNVEYIRNPKEPLIPFIKNIGLGYKPINLVKNIILNILSIKIDKYLDKNNMKKMYMWGLVMSGEMDFDRIKKLYPQMKKYAYKKNRKLEILFHPGLALESEYREELNKEDMKNANTSNNRIVEKKAVMNMKELIIGE